MTAVEARHRAQAVLSVPIWAWGLFAATAGWSALVVGAYLGSLVVPQPRLLALGVPLALGAAVALSRPRAPGPLKLAAGWAGILGASLLVAPYAIAGSALIYVLPLLLLAAAVCWRWPTPAVIGAFAITGTYGSIDIYTRLPAHRLLDLVLAALWTAAVWSYLMSRRDRRLWLWPGVALSLAYLFVTLVQALAAQNLQQGLDSFRFSAWYMLAFVLIAYGGLSPATLRRIARVVVLIIAAVGGYAVLRWQIGPSGKETALAHSGGPYNVVDGKLSAFGSFQGGHALASWAAPMAVYSLAAVLSLRGRWQVVAGAAAAFCITAVLATQVRAGLLGMVGGAVVVFALYQISRGFPGPHLGVTAVALVCAVGITVVAFAVALNTDTSRSRYTILTTPERDPSVQRRLQKWGETINEVRDAPLGKGLGSSGHANEKYGRFVSVATYNLDNSYLKIALDQGIFILVLFAAAALGLLYSLMRGGLATAHAGKAGIAIGASGAFTTFLIICATGMYIEGLPALAVWMLIGLAVGQFASPDHEPV